MVMQNHVTNQEISKKIKELGIKQESEFYWSKQTGKITLEYKTYFRVDKRQDISAFLSSELGEMLYNAFDKHGWNLLYESYGKVFNFEGTQRIGDIGIINLMRNPDFAGLILIYLKENNLI